MFRENVLVREDIISRISETMIPVALDYQKVLDRDSRESRFVRSMIEGSGDIQGVRVMTPDGKILGKFSGFDDIVGKSKRLIEDALEAFGTVEPRAVARGKANRERGKGVRADGSVSLAEYVRRRDRDKIKSPVISTVELSDKEFAHFGPSKAAPGETWLVPDAVAKKFCRAASPMCYQHAPQPEWVKDIHLRVRVVQVEGGRATLSYEGKLSSERLWQNGKILSEQALTLRGEGVYDLATKKMQSLLILGSGSFCWPEEKPDQPITFDALIEWESATL